MRFLWRDFHLLFAFLRVLFHQTQGIVYGFSGFHNLSIIEAKGGIKVIAQIAAIILIETIQSVFRQHIAKCDNRIIILITEFFGFFCSKSSPARYSIFLISLANRYGFRFFNSHWRGETSVTITSFSERDSTFHTKKVPNGF